MKRAEELAGYEIGWWKAHHRKEMDEIISNMSSLYQSLYGLSPEDARECARLRTEAGKVHDRAEELEDVGELEEAEEYWDKAEELLAEYFEILLEKTEG